MSMPKGYFDDASERLVTDFREMVLADPREELMEGFPDSALIRTLQRTWRSSATAIYRNWLRYMVSKESEMSKFSAVSAVHEEIQRKRSALP